MYLFGSGVMIITPQGVTPATPINIGLLQEVSIDVSRTLKAIYGQVADPLAIGAGTRKWSGKAKVARLGGSVLNALILGGTVATGSTTASIGEAWSVPSATAYTVTVANSATWTADLGVVYAATGLPLKCVAAVSAAGQYSVAAGVYTFYSADASAKVLISYNYTVASAGQTISIPSPLIGQPLVWTGNFSGIDPTTGKFTNWTFYNCVCEKLSWGTKLEDFAAPEIDFQCYANSALAVGQVNLPDQF